MAPPPRGRRRARCSPVARSAGRGHALPKVAGSPSPQGAERRDCAQERPKINPIPPTATPQAQSAATAPDRRIPRARTKAPPHGERRSAAGASPTCRDRAPTGTRPGRRPGRGTWRGRARVAREPARHQPTRTTQKRRGAAATTPPAGRPASRKTSSRTSRRRQWRLRASSGLSEFSGMRAARSRPEEQRPQSAPRDAKNPATHHMSPEWTCPPVAK